MVKNYLDITVAFKKEFVITPGSTYIIFNLKIGYNSVHTMYAQFCENPEKRLGGDLKNY